MSVTVSDGDGQAWSFAPEQSQPWVGAYNPAVGDLNYNDLHYTATVTFPNAGMYSAFVKNKGVQASGLWSPGSQPNTEILSY
jgi:hypothetical protein